MKFHRNLTHIPPIKRVSWQCNAIPREVYYSAEPYNKKQHADQLFFPQNNLIHTILHGRSR